MNVLGTKLGSIRMGMYFLVSKRGSIHERISFSSFHEQFLFLKNRETFLMKAAKPTEARAHSLRMHDFVRMREWIISQNPRCSLGSLAIGNDCASMNRFVGHMAASSEWIKPSG